MKIKDQKINVKWEHEGKTYTGYLEITQETDGIRITASDNQRHHCFYNELLTEDEASSILEDIELNEFDITYIL